MEKYFAVEVIAVDVDELSDLVSTLRFPGEVLILIDWILLLLMLSSSFCSSNVAIVCK